MKERVKADIVIIGDGIAGLSLAYIAAQRGIRTAVLGKNFKGTTHTEVTKKIQSVFLIYGGVNIGNQLLIVFLV